MNKQFRFTSIFLLLCILMTVQASAQSVTIIENVDAHASIMTGCINIFRSDEGSLDRTYFVPMSPARSERFRRFYSTWLDTLKKISFDKLTVEDRVDYILFKNYLEHQTRQLDIEARRFAEIDSLVPFARRICDFEESRRMLQGINPQQIAVVLNEMNKQLTEMQKRIESQLSAGEKKPSKIKKTVANRASETAKSLKRALKEWYTFYNGYDPIFTWWVEEPYNKFDKTLQDYATFLREKLAGVKEDDKTTIIGDPIGNNALLSELQYEMIPYTPQELIAIANKEMAWCDSEMVKASRSLGYGDDWHKAFEYVKTKYVEPGKQPALIRDLALEAIKFLDDHNLVTIPDIARESWRMEMMTPERQLVAPFFLGGEVIQVSYPTNTMGHEQKMMSMRGNNVHFARATVHHELIPGHHLQGFMNDRYKTYRGLFSTPFWYEGNALYWEMLFWDLGFQKSAENRIGMLFWRKHRCARIIFSLSYHLEKMTAQECVDFLVDRVGHERDNATAEVRRSVSGGYGPLYQCAYLLGGLQFRAMHKELVDSGTMTNRQFHDAILKENAIPVEMVRALLTKQELPRDFTSKWKFYDLK